MFNARDVAGEPDSSLSQKGDGQLSILILLAHRGRPVENTQCMNQ